MINRLPYETIAGDLSPSVTFEQLLEYIRRAEEDARILARAARSDLTRAKWTFIAENFSRVFDIVNNLYTSHSASSVGYDGHA